jgi:ATP-dependent DNA helicase RecQ
VTCRHASLIEHFGQPWTYGPCNACDVCLGKLEVVDDALVIAQKILSCVLRVREGYGADYVSLVLTGSKEQRILAAGHDQLSTWGILSEFRRQDVRQWIEQLVNQGYLGKEGEYHLLRVTQSGRHLLAGEVAPTLLRPVKEQRGPTRPAMLDSWEGVDQGLFDALRQLRRDEATRRAVPAYIVFSDTTLRDMARRRPSSAQRLQDVHGVGQQKSSDFGRQFIDCIVAYCRQHEVPMDIPTEAQTAHERSAPPASAVQSFPLFDEGLSVEEASQRLGRALSTTYGYLEAYIRHRRVTDITRWISRHEFEQIEAVVEHAGIERLKPIYEALHGRISYERIRLAVASLANRPPARTNEEPS